MTRGTNNRQNLASESFGLEMILSKDSRLLQPNLMQKKKVLEICNLPNLYRRSFDLIRLNVDDFSKVKSVEDFALIEVKVTRKALPNFPKGFFFGMTENEEKLLKELGNSFFLCLVSIADFQLQYEFLNYEQLQSLIRTKRVQFQITL